MVRDVLLVIFAAVWAVVVVITLWRSGTVPAELWAVLGIGVGGILAAFRTDDRLSGKHPADHDPGNPT